IIRRHPKVASATRSNAGPMHDSTIVRLLSRILQSAFSAKCVALAVALYLSTGEASAQPRRIVIDCDPGIDDAMAIVLALQYAGFEVVGISTAFGNAYVDQATQNALTIVE